jgi:steroid delta-isomerase-like uncharacterized protein
MTKASIVKNFEERYKHWRYRDVDGLASAYAPDAVVVSPIFGEVQGREAIAASFQELLKVFHGWTFDPDELVISGNRVAQVFQMQGMHSQAFFGLAPTWKPFTVQGAMFLKFADGRIVRERRVYDLSTMLFDLEILKRD